MKNKLSNTQLKSYQLPSISHTIQKLQANSSRNTKDLEFIIFSPKVCISMQKTTKQHKQQEPIQKNDPYHDLKMILIKRSLESNRKNNGYRRTYTKKYSHKAVGNYIQANQSYHVKSAKNSSKNYQNKKYIWKRSNKLNPLSFSLQSQSEKIKQFQMILTPWQTQEIRQKIYEDELKFISEQ